MATAWAHAPASSAAGVGQMSAGLRLEVLGVLLALVALYALGWWRLSRRASRPPGPRGPALLLVALVALAVALVSPLDGLAETSFAAHMVQHMLLISIAAPALVLADPFPLVVWALPGAARRRAARVIGRASVAGRLWRAATAMGPAWVVSAGILWGWHVPGAYDAALSRRWLHDLEHASFFLAAVLFWWPVVHPAPRFRRGASYPARVVYLVLGAFQTAALGLLLALAPAVLYRAYVETAGALDDQSRGGIVMWAVGGLTDMIAVLVLVYRALGPGSPPPGGRPSLASSPARTEGHSESRMLK